MTSRAAVPLQQRRLVARSARPFALAVVVLAAGVTVVFSVLLYDRRTLTRFDLRYGRRIGGWFGGHERTAVHLADLGGPVPVFVAVFVIAVVMLLLRRLRAVALAVLAPPIAVVLTEAVLKPLIDRSPWGTYTFPSGHTTAAFSVATVLAVLLLDERNAGSRALRWPAVVAAFVLATFVALGLVAAGYHFFSDTIGGAAVGIAVPVLVALAIDAVADRRSQPVAHPGPAPQLVGDGGERRG